jgi:peptide/nickel transport system substrate-binding protein
MTDVDRPSEAGDGTRIDRSVLLQGSLGAGIALATSGTLGGLLVEAATAAAAKPKRGGTLSVGIVGGSAKDSLDGHRQVAQPDIARAFQLYETLAKFDEHYKIILWLAEEITQDKPSQWTIRLKPGIHFHNGKLLGADDVIYTIRRILNKKIGAEGAPGLASVDPKRMKKLDAQTVRLFLARPDSTILDNLAQRYNPIVPVGYNPEKPIGTGPFKFKSFFPGQRSTFVRHDAYWRTGLPYLDSVVIIDFPDDNARLNALLGGQVQAIDAVPITQVASVIARKDIKLLNSPSARWLPFTMNVTTPPFDDKRVRQAMRLIVDRPQMVKIALNGYGRIANDLFSPFDPSYSKGLPQRTQDIDTAKSLLQQAGQAGLKVTLTTSNFAAGAVAAAQVFAQQAAAAGVTVTVDKVDGATFYGPNYLKWPFAMDIWGTRNYLAQVAQGMLPTSPYNESNWPDASHTDYVAKYAAAVAAVSLAKRAKLIQAMQREEWDDGGLIIWGFTNFVDAYSTKISGIKVDASTPLNSYGFGHAWLG